MLSVAKCPPPNCGGNILSKKLSPMEMWHKKQGSGAERSHFSQKSTSHCLHRWTISMVLGAGMLSMPCQCHSQVEVQRKIEIYRNIVMRLVKMKTNGLRYAIYA